MARIIKRRPKLLRFVRGWLSVRIGIKWVFGNYYWLWRSIAWTQELFQIFIWVLIIFGVDLRAGIVCASQSTQSFLVSCDLTVGILRFCYKNKRIRNLIWARRYFIQKSNDGITFIYKKVCWHYAKIIVAAILGIFVDTNQSSVFIKKIFEVIWKKLRKTKCI